MDAPGAEAWLLVLGAAAGTYAWRALGVLLSGRIKMDSALFNWTACVAYAMVAGLIARLIVMPAGLLAATALIDRLLGVALALTAFYATRKNLFVAVITGVAVIIVLDQARRAFALG